MLQALLATAFAVLASLIWAHAGGLKVARPSEYSMIAEGYLGRPVAPVLLRLLGAIELLLAVFILLPSSRAWAAVVSASLLLCYAGVMWRQIDTLQVAMRCGCGGFASNTRVSSELVVRNLCLVLVMIYLGFPVATGHHQVVAVGVIMGAGLYICYLAVDQLIANSQQLRGLA